MKKLIWIFLAFSAFQPIYIAAAQGSPQAGSPKVHLPQKQNINHFAPIDFKKAARREALNPPVQAEEIEPIEAPLPRPDHKTTVPIRQIPGDSKAAPLSPTPSLQGASPSPTKTFMAEFLSSTTIPPDTMGAVGTNYVLTVSNDRVRIQTRDGVEISRLTLSSFWSGVTIKGAAASAFDPKVVYDRFNDRFIIVSSANGTGVNSGALFAVSATADPTGTWYRWSVVADPASTGAPGGSGKWIDYPSLGHNKNFIVIDENVFNYTCNTTTCSNVSFWGTQIYVLDKQAAYNNTLSTINLFSGDFVNTCQTSATPQTELACGFTMVPAITEDNTTDTEYMVEDWDSTAGQLRLSKVTGTPGAPVITAGTQFPQSTNSWRFDAARIGTTGGYMPQRQQSANLPSGSRIMANDARIQNAVLRNGKLWTTHTVMLSSTPQPAGTTIGGTGNPIDNHAAIQWWQIDPTNETGASTAPLQLGRLEDPTANNCHNGTGGTSSVPPCNGTTSAQFGTFFAFPNISVNKNEDAVIGFSVFSPLTYPNSGYAFRSAGDPANSVRDFVIFRPGQANYNIGAGSGTARQDRWGDYSAAQTDPLNDTDFWVVQEYAGTQRNDFLAPSYAGPWETWWAQISPTNPAASSGTMIISEFRLRGPQGARDEFVKLHNPGSTPVIVSTSDNSDGWALAYSANGATVSQVFAVVPNGTVIPPHGYFLVANNPDNTANGTSAKVYSLNSYAGVASRNANSDTGYALDLADNGGIALFNTANTANFNSTTRLDSVGFSTISSGLFKEGNGIPAITATTPGGQYSFVRQIVNGSTVDTGANENDFVFVDPVVGESFGVIPILGAAGPQNLDGPTRAPNNTDITITLVDPGVTADDSPNRDLNLGGNTMALRRTFTNNSGVSITTLRFRTHNITTDPASVGVADLRANSSSDSTVATSTGTANIKGLTLESPPIQASGGGLNSTLSLALSTPLAPGASVNVEFLLNIQQQGTYSFGTIAETFPSLGSQVAVITGDMQNHAPSVTTQPGNQSVCAGSNVSFSAASSGWPARTVKWQVSTDGGSTFNDIPGATSTTYIHTASSPENGYQYQAVFTNIAGSATSNAATLTVNTVPSVTANPTDQTVSAGSTATFTTTATGTPGVQWQVSTDGGSTFNDIPGATSTTLSFSADAGKNGYKYRATFTTACGSATSSAATLTVIQPPSIAKSFNPTSIPLNGNSTLSFSISNPNTNTVLSGVAFSDSLPTGLGVAATPNITGSCGSGTINATAGSGTVSLSGGTLAASPAAGSTCTFSVDVTGTTAGVKNNSVQVSSTEGGTGNTSNASLTVIAPPTIGKGFNPTSIPLNSNSTLSFTISNPNTAGSLSGVAFSDSLPSGVVVAAAPNITGSCGSGTITATAGSGTISLSGGTLAASPAAGSSCTFTVDVTGTGAGDKSNTTGAISSTEGGAGTTSNTTVLTVVAPPSVAEVFTQGGVALNATTSLQFTITNPANNTVALTGVAFSDTLPTGLTVASSTATVCGGTLTVTNPTGISLTGATIAANGQCQFSVTVTGATAGQYTNTTGGVTSTNGGTGNSASASLTVQSADLTITSTHVGNFVQGQTGAVYMVTVSNVGAGPTSGTVSVTDILPVGLTATAISGTGWTCNLSPLGCTRSDSLAASANYPVITTTVSVAANAASSITNTANVSGGGDVNLNNNSSSDPTTTVPAAFTITANPSSVTIGSGQSANVTLTITGNMNFPMAAVLTCSTNSPAVTCGFNPSTLNVGTVPATSTLTLTSTGLAALPYNPNRDPWSHGVWFAMLGVPAIVVVTTRGRRQNKKRSPWLLATLGMLLMLLMVAGCGGHPSNLPITTPTTYTLQVNVAVGTTQATVPLTVTVTH